MNKRGISPLIASVLLIAFAVTIFLVITGWVRREVVEPSLEEGGAKYAAGLECMSTKIDVKKACVDDKDAVTSLKMNVDNTGSTDVYKLSIRLVGNGGDFSDIKEYAPASAVPPPGRVLKYGDGVQSMTITNLERVDVFPHAKGGLCQDNVVSVSASRVDAPC